MSRAAWYILSYYNVLLSCDYMWMRMSVLIQRKKAVWLHLTRIVQIGGSTPETRWAALSRDHPACVIVDVSGPPTSPRLASPPPVTLALSSRSYKHARFVVGEQRKRRAGPEDAPLPARPHWHGHRSGGLIYSGTMPEVLGGKGELSVITLLVRCGFSQVSGCKKLRCVDSHPDSLLGEWCNG